MTQTNKEKTIERMADKVMSEIFYEAQPDKGDIFSFVDDIKEQIAKAAYEASGSEHIPALVEALEYAKLDAEYCIKEYEPSMPIYRRLRGSIARIDKTLAALPEELRGK